jgi:hypothetical protein
MNETNSLVVAQRATQAMDCFGTNALPALTLVAYNGRHPCQVVAILTILNIVDRMQSAEFPIPALINCLNDTNGRYVQFAALKNLRKLKKDPALCIPAFIECLQSTNFLIRERSAFALRDLGPQATNAIPALTKALADPDRRVSAAAASALHAIDPAIYTNNPPTTPE